MSEEYGGITKRLQAAFAAGTRVVFWEDAGGQFTEYVSDLDLPGIKVLPIEGNALTAKRLILREDKDSSYLLYRTSNPQFLDDLLYDVKLAAKPFSASRSSVFAEECGIPPTLQQVVEDSPRFFESKERRESLAATCLSKSTSDELSLAMLAACFNIKEGTRHDVMREVIARLITRWVKGDSYFEKLLDEAGLMETFWRYARQVTGYSQETPSIEDLGCELLAAACAPAMDNPSQLTADASIIVSKLAQGEDFEDFVSRVKPAVLDGLRSNLDAQTLEQLDYLPEFDEQLLAIGMERLNNGTITAEIAAEKQEKRFGKYWYNKKFKPYYATLAQAAALSERLASFERELSGTSGAKELVSRYASAWTYIDRAYRLFNVAYGELPMKGKFKDGIAQARELLLRKYDRYLEDLAVAWQAAIAQQKVWPPTGTMGQDQFYGLVISAANPKDEDGERVAAIVSDAFRYELATELKERLKSKRQRAKLRITLEPMLSALPSYTQLGMAALLPHSELAINPDDLSVNLDGKPSAGLANRAVALEAKAPKSAVFGVGQEPDDDTLRKSSIVYAYLNTVDKTGDDRTSEHKVFSVAEETFKEIERLIDTLLSSGYKEIIVTADHGFIYQAGRLDEYAFIDIETLPEVKAAFGGKNTRRFIVAPAIPSSEYLLEFDAASLSLEGDYSIAVPKGIRRIRVKGSGAAYVHGGATLQELVVPLLKIKRDTKRATEAQPSEVELFDTGRGVITGSGITATLYQTEPVGDEVLASQVEAAVFAADGKLVSNEVQVTLASSSPEPESRKTKFTVTLTAEADDYETVELRVRRRRGETNKYETLITHPYKMNRAMGMDF
jgi:uncharacterized protein (TIGR02687 family)